jgi:hypothetical protein
MTRLAQLAARAFRQAWMANGQPTLLVIGPYTEWRMPRGYHYDASVDHLVDASGNSVDDPSIYWTTYTVNMIPAGAVDEAYVLGPAGITPDGSTTAIILPADIATVRHAFQVQVDGDWYNVTDVKAEPAGALTPTWATVTLKRRS